MPPGAFRPAPKVTSSVVHLEFLGAPAVDDALAPVYGRVVRAAFAQRRKTLENSLRSGGFGGLAAAAGLDPGRRAETLSIGEFVRLARAAAAGTARPPGGAGGG